jgi:glycosyltransferase involved in cell wall biosynthesis
MKPDRITLLVFIDWFFPGYKGGGPIESCKNLVESLITDYNIYVVTRDVDFGDRKPYANIESNVWLTLPSGVKVKYLSEKNLTLSTIFAVVREVSPNHIYLNSMFSRFFSIYPLLLNFFGVTGKAIQITLAPRGMLLASALSKKKMKKEFFLRLSKFLYSKKNVRFHATNEAEKQAVALMYPGNRIFVANNLPFFGQLPYVGIQKRKGELRLLYLARIDPIKNLILLIKILKQVRENVLLTIAGPVEDRVYWEECLQEMRALPPNAKVEIIGPVPKEQVGNIILDHHLYVLLTQGENFGHTIFEALVNGRPVLISDQTPWQKLETIGIGLSARLEDHPNIMEYICRAIDWDQEEFDVCSRKTWKYAHDYLQGDLNRALYLEIFV